MQLTIIPTNLVYEKYHKPLSELDYTHFHDAYVDYVITQAEYQFVTATSGFLVLSKEEFTTLQRNRFNNIPK